MLCFVMISTLFPYTTLFRSHLVSYQSFQSGKTIQDIATIRSLSKQTIEGHIFRAYKEGYPIVWDIFFNETDRKSTRLNSSHVTISYADFCLKKKNNEYLYLC